MNRHRGAAEDVAIAVGATADDASTDHVLRLISQISRRTNLRLDIYRRGIAVADARGDVGYACAFKHLTHIDKQDQEILEGLIDRLQR